MRISRFFIDRPIFAAVVSLVFVILGVVSFGRLPVAQYPEIAPPVINITGQYPGASADVVAATVVTPLEQQINGVENMLYITSNSTGDGRFSIAVTFDLGTNLDIAQVQVQNRVAIAQPRLPVDVRNIGVTVAKASPDLMMVVHMLSPDKSRSELFISNYAALEVKDALTRVQGVGSIVVRFGGLLAAADALVALIQPMLPFVQLPVPTVDRLLAEQRTLVLSARLFRHQPGRLEHHRNHLLVRLRVRVVELSL
jgi:multidrug efflux pump subunit AcrB